MKKHKRFNFFNGSFSPFKKIIPQAEKAQGMTNKKSVSNLAIMVPAFVKQETLDPWLCVIAFRTILPLFLGIYSFGRTWQDTDFIVILNIAKNNTNLNIFIQFPFFGQKFLKFNFKLFSRINTPSYSFIRSPPLNIAKPYSLHL